MEILGDPVAVALLRPAAGDNQSVVQGGIVVLEARGQLEGVC